MSDPLPIVGGGIAGLTAALALAHRDEPTIVYEKAEAFDEVGAGLQLSPNAMGILRKLGLEPALRVAAIEPEGISIRDGRSDRQIARLPLGEQARSRYDAPYFVIHRADLQKVLVDACNANDRIEIALGRTMDVRPSDGVLIAADGVHSEWRAQLRQKSHKKFSGYVAWRTTIPSDGQDVTNARVWMGPNAHVVSYPIRSGRERNFVVLARAEDPRPIRSDPQKKLLEALQGWNSALQATLLQHEGWTPWPLFTVDPRDPWVNENIALVGDAAHAMLPFLAQGAAMAIEDAWVLSQMLTGSSQLDQALARYEMARKARVTRVWDEAARNGAIYHMGGPLALARNTVLRSLSGGALLRRYDWLYKWQASET